MRASQVRRTPFEYRLLALGFAFQDIVPLLLKEPDLYIVSAGVRKCAFEPGHVDERLVVETRRRHHQRCPQKIHARGEFSKKMAATDHSANLTPPLGRVVCPTAFPKFRSRQKLVAVSSNIRKKICPNLTRSASDIPLYPPCANEGSVACGGAARGGEGRGLSWVLKSSLSVSGSVKFVEFLRFSGVGGGQKSEWPVSGGRGCCVCGAHGMRACHFADPRCYKSGYWSAGSENRRRISKCAKGFSSWRTWKTQHGKGGGGATQTPH
jgi:hypothetical protein